MIARFVEFFSLSPQLFSISKSFIGNVPSGFSNGFSEFKSYINNWSFDNEIRTNGGKYFEEFLAKQNKLITLLMAFNFFAYGETSFKVLNKPLDNFKICINNNHPQREVVLFPANAVCPLPFNTKMAFAIEQSGSVGEYFCGNQSLSLSSGSLYATAYHKLIINYTLNDLTSGSHFGYAKVCSHIESMRRWVEEPVSPNRKYLVTKVTEKLYVAINQQVTLQNQDPICN